MSDLLIARLDMAISLAFHMFFAVAGIGMPLLMVIAEGLWLRTKDNVYLTLAKRWAKGTAILFAVGAVSGTVLSFELGLFWPEFMRFSGPIIGVPFSLEGFAFFAEAIFLGIYLYGWNRVPPKIHWLSGGMVALSGMISGIFVVTTNAWMNNPTGFRLENGMPVDIDPIAGMLNPGSFQQTLHMTIAAYLAAGAAVVGVHAFMLLRDRTNLFHRRALAIALSVMTVATILQPISGDISAKFVAKHQPAKLAAMEGQFETEIGAPLRIGGIPDAEEGVTRFSIDVPYLLSILAFNDPQAEVKGLNEFPRDEWPNPLITHMSFQIMVASGTILMIIGLISAFWAWRKKTLPDNPKLLWAMVISAPLGMIGVQTGWAVTEVGRQPWIIYQIMRTEDAVTPMQGLLVWFIIFMVVYIFLAAMVIWLLWQLVLSSPSAEEAIHGEQDDDEGSEKEGDYAHA